jgi:hypothetical protein
MTLQLAKHFFAFMGTVTEGHCKAPMRSMLNDRLRTSTYLIPITTLSHNSRVSNFNPLEGHTIRKDSPEGRTCVYVFVYIYIINK